MEAIGHLEEGERNFEIFSLRNSGIVTDLAFPGPSLSLSLSLQVCKVWSGEANHLWVLYLQFIQCN